MDPKTTETLLTWLQTAGYCVAAILFDRLGIPQGQMSIFGALMIIDILTGYLKVRKVDKNQFTSQKLTDGIIKKMLVMLTIITFAFMCQGVRFNGFAIDPKHFLEIALSAMIVAETYSIIQNVYIHRTGHIVKEHDAFTIVYKAFSNMLLVLLKKIIKILNTVLWSN